MIIITMQIYQKTGGEFIPPNGGYLGILLENNT